jgi:hypothetical protein
MSVFPLVFLNYITTGPDHNRPDEKDDSEVYASRQGKLPAAGRISVPLHTHRRNNWEHTCSWRADRAKQPFDRTGLSQGPAAAEYTRRLWEHPRGYTRPGYKANASLCGSFNQQTGLEKQDLKLFHPYRKKIPAMGSIAPGVHQQHQVIAGSQPVPNVPVCLPAHPPSPVPFYGIAVFPGESKGYPVTIKPIRHYKQLSAGTGNGLSPVKPPADLIPSL